MTRIQEMARWVASLKYSDIPEAVRDRAKRQILSVIAAAHAGGISPAAKKLVAAVKSWDGGGNFPLITNGEGLSLHGALFANASLCMAHDYDDYLFLGHTGHSAVFTSLLVALKEGRSIEEMMAAQVAANEVGGRMGAACLIGPQNGQVWTFIHLVAAAAAASKLMGLDAQQTAHALAIALYQPNFALFPGFMGPDTKLLSASQTSLGGLMAAELAREGFTGPLDVIENRQGFLNQFSYAPLEFMLTGYGKSWVTESIAFKLVPGCAYIDTAVDAMMMALDKFKRQTGRELGPQDVREIEVKASMLTTEMDRLSAAHVGQGELNPIALNFSIAANLAIVVLAGGLRVEHLDPDWLELHREEITALCRRIRLQHDWSMSIGVTEAFRKVLDLGKIVDHVGLGKLIGARRKAARHLGGEVSLGLKDFMEMRKAAGDEGREYVKRMASGFWKGLFTPKRRAGLPGQERSGPPDLGESDFSKFTMPFAAEVMLKTTDWKEYSARQDIPWGAPGQPWEDTSRRVKDKFRREAKRNLSDEQIEWIMSHIDTIERVASVKELLENLHPTPESRKYRAAKARERRDAPPPPREKAKPFPPPPSEKAKAPPSPPAIPSSDNDLPPIIFEPVTKPPHIPRERPRPQPETREAKPLPAKKAPEREHFQPVAKPKAVGVTMRRAKRGEKQPRPSKGAKRTRSRRP